MANEFKVKKGLIVDGSNTVLDIQGTQGQLFSVTDSLTGDLFSVSDVSGVPILNVNSSGIVDIDGKLGVGVESPAQQLHVVGNQVRLDTAGGGYYLHNTSGTFRGAFHDNGTVTSIYADGNGSTPALSIESNNVTFAGAVEVNGNFVVDGAGVSTDFQLRRSVNAAALLTINAPGGSPNGSVFSINGNSVMTLDADQNATFEGNITTSGVGGDGTPILDITGTASATFNWISKSMHANLTSGETNIHIFGQHASTKNSGYIGYTHSGTSGSDNNKITLGMYGANHLLTISPTTATFAGKVGVGMAATDQLEVAGNIRANVSNAGGFMLTANSASGLVRESATGLALRTNTTDQLIIDNSGNATFTEHVTLSKDNRELRFGVGTDLKLYSNGTDGYVVAPVDDLVLQAADNVYIYTQGGENALIAHGNDRVEIFYDNEERLRTTADGIKVSKSGNDTTAKVLVEGHNNTGTPGQATSGTFEHRGEHLKTVITHNGSDVITIGTGTQTVFAGNVDLGDASNISMNATTAGHLRVLGNGYTGGIALDANAMHIYHNSSSRNLILGTNETARLTIAGDSGNTTITGTVETTTLRTDVVNNKANSANIIYRSGTNTLVGGGGTALKFYVQDGGNAGVGDAAPTSISANTYSLSVNSSRTDLSGALINKANGTIKHQQYWDSSGYGFNLSANSGDFKWKVNNNDRMVVDKDGGLDIQGTAGQLFSVTNSLSGDIFSVSDVSGVPILNVNSSGNVDIDGKLGIGTDSPTHSLHVKKPVSGNATLMLESVTGGDPTIIFNSAAANRSGVINFQDNGTQTGQITYKHNGDSMEFYTGGASTSGHLELKLKESEGATFRTNVIVNGNLIGKSNHTTELGDYTNGQIKRIRMSQGGEAVFGDSTTANPIGLTEGVWNSFGDSDYMSIYSRNSFRIHGYGTSSSPAMHVFVGRHTSSGGSFLHLGGGTSPNGTYGVSNTILTVKGTSSGGEGIIQIVGLGNNATDNVGCLAFHSQAEADPMASIRSVRGNADDVGSLTFNTNNG